MFTNEQILTSAELKGQRTLAAIVFTDVVGYSALMAAREEYTLDLLRRDFQLMKQLCDRFEGKILKTIGDALLMYFASAVQAVACSREIQSSLAKLTQTLAPEEILIHRIGIHLGDVFFNGSDVMGDGVNVAARLQAEAQPGGICLSQTVYDVVKNPLALKATDLVQRKLKNMPGLVSVYQIPPLSPTSSLNQWGLASTQIDINEFETVIYTSGQWILLGDRFFEIETYSHATDGRQIFVQIPSKGSEDDAAIQALRPKREPSPPLKFAYQNDGLFVKIKSLEATPRADYQLWTIALEPKHLKNDGNTLVEQSYKGRKQSFSADEIAKLKAGRILLNDPPKLQMLQDAQIFSPAMAERELIENLIRGSGTPVAVEDCVLQSLYPAYKHNPGVFLELARLQAVFLLKAIGIIDRVLELSLGPISQGKVHVKFRGKRRQIYAEIEPTVIELEGDCPLVSEGIANS